MQHAGYKITNPERERRVNSEFDVILNSPVAHAPSSFDNHATLIAQ